MARERITFVLKVSKFCNLRCNYCYEYRELADQRRMQLPDLRRIFENVREFVAESATHEVGFVWHGGEPFLIPIEYYEEVDRLQQNVFSGFSVRNTVQTNLTVLTRRHVQFLKESSFFSDLGISFDVYGDQRVDAAGRLWTNTVLRNMQALIDNSIPFGAIAVLARNTLQHLPGIYGFFDDLRIALRVLAFYKQADEAQARVHALSYGELLQAYQILFELWATSAIATPVDPIESFIDGAAKILSGTPVPPYSIEEDENVFLVNPDGSLWGEADCYHPRYCYGNIVESSLKALLASPGRIRATLDAQERVQAICQSCLYRDFCTGEFIATATRPQRMLMQHGCLRREMLSYVAERLAREELNSVSPPDRNATLQPLPLSYSPEAGGGKEATRLTPQ